MKDYAGKTLWIIGASSGIGHALALELGKRGASLILSARNETALNDLNAMMGHAHKVIAFDVVNPDAYAQAISRVKELSIDSVIYMSAAYTPGKIAGITHENVQTTLKINLEAAFDIARDMVAYFTMRGGGQIALCGSVAGYCGLPGGQPYSATKAAIINLAESLHSEMADSKIDIKLISSGFVRTPLTDKNDFDMPMMIEPEEAAGAIADGLLTKSFEIHFPKKFTMILKLIQLLPYALYFRIANKLNR